MALFLVYHRPTAQPISLAEPMHPLADGVLLLRSDRTLSRVYHDVKARLPKDAPLCVARLDGPPKFKGMADGALKWVRDGVLPPQSP